ncbi:BTB/POZ domain-containing protein 9-like [Adelges cooleyi]|uniref:BTB/POZ domain-containing protein 9-like n=1 Tax=Adelges cooleyi TaxID=133065 RepID=UPI00217FE59D|nr:BTB/POZ domain-containing protein 9-like [Adelges cooleyi]
MMFVYFIALIVLILTPAFSCPTEHASSSSNPVGCEQIDHASLMPNDYSQLYQNKKNADVILVVDNTRFHAHRTVLASRSDYFSALLFGGHKEARDMEVPIKEGSATSVKVLLQYIYTGRINLSTLQSKIVLELLILSSVFSFTNLQHSLSEYLWSKIDVNNVSTLFAVALYYQIKELEVKLFNFINIHALDVLESKDSLSLTPEVVLLILNRDTAYINELDKFRAVCRWIKTKKNELDSEAKTKILSAVRYQLMNDEELSEVRRSELVRSDRIILDAINLRIVSLPQEFNDRGRLEPNVNFAEDTSNEISQIDDGTMIMLGHPSNINYIEMKLNDELADYYTYYIEVSMDMNDWLRVIDHSIYHCRSIQRLWINRIFVRYIRIVGTNITSNKTFNFLKIMYTTAQLHLFKIKNGLVAPKYDIASPTMDWAVLKNDPECVLIQLAQPYMLSSMRLLINDGNNPTCGYIIHASVNNEDWELIADKSKKPARSWQFLKFDSTLTVYIRITAVRTSIIEDLIIKVYIEAPAQVSLDCNAMLKRSRSIFCL